MEPAGIICNHIAQIVDLAGVVTQNIVLAIVVQLVGLFQHMLVVGTEVVVTSVVVFVQMPILNPDKQKDINQLLDLVVMILITMVITQEGRLSMQILDCYFQIQLVVVV